MDYDLSRLTSRDFEHVIQSLTMRALGPSVSVFGDGPDGGREATFEGRAQGVGMDDWDGYVVVQAKFHQRAGDAARDGAWFLEQLERELAGYADGSARRRPDYLLLTTNVVLTPPLGGLKDKLRERMERASTELGLKGWHVWAYDELRALIDGDEGVRHANWALITPGDVLHAAMAALGDAAPEFERTIVRFLQQELLADQYAKLEQAGHDAEAKLPLGPLFVDLPIQVDPLDRGRALEFEQPYGCVHHLATLGPRRHDRSLPVVDEPPDVEATGDGQRVVLVGGPGQGKSTVGQLLCQLHRTVLLAERDPRTLAPEVRHVLADLRVCVEREEIPFPSIRRFPVRVTLSAFAEALADGEGAGSLLEYLVQRVRERTGDEVSLPLFRRWLEQHPWLIVLDGLDEVPRTSNRDAVLEAVQAFWVDVAAARSDVLVVATTRPQGYNEDFSPREYAHYRLLPLDRDEALRYGTLLAGRRHPDEPETAALAVRRLERAADTEATRRLMGTPLQVTIMAALLDHRGDPPEDRWNLFKEYYETIYLREMRRDIPAAKILRAYRSHINVIHQRVALLLQVKSERARQTDARLSHEQLAAVVEQRLAAEGEEEPRLSELREEILDAAAQRLVFLVGLQHDSVGFELRSLQEFMAAKCLMTESEEAESKKLVVERLSAVAGVASWRNVVLFAAGHCFADREGLRSDVVGICTDLSTDDADPLACSRFAGASLAAEIVADGAVVRQPTFKRRLITEAARGFRSVVPAGSVRLTELHDADVDATMRRALDEALGGGEVCRAAEGWRTLLGLEQRGVPWASELIERHWPARSRDALMLLRLLDGSAFGPTAARLLSETVAALPFDLAALEGERIARVRDVPEPLWAYRLLHAGGDPTIEVPLLAEQLGRHTMSLLMPPLSEKGVLPFDARRLDASWQPLAAVARFSQEPSAASLAAALRITAGSAAEPVHWRDALRVDFPWPLAACFAFADSREQLLALADAAKAGALGDRTAWRTAEARWTERGMTLEDLLHTAALPDLPFDAEVGAVGGLLSVGAWKRRVGRADALTLSLLREVYASTRSPHNRRTLASFLLLDFEAGVSLTELAEWCAASGETPTELRMQSVAAWLDEGDPADAVALLDPIARESSLLRPLPGVPLEGAVRMVPRLVEAVGGHPEAGGLWLLLAQAIAFMPPDEARAVATRLHADPLPQDPLARACAAVVRGFDLREEAEAELLAEAIAGVAAAHSGRVAQALPPAGAAPSAAAHELLLARLAERLPCAWLSARITVASRANDMLLQRTSALADLETWRALDLFERDERLLQP